MPASVTSQSSPNKRRSCCPVSAFLEIFGDKWTLLVIRDLWFGERRFKDFTTAPERIPTNILSDRLARLTRLGIITQPPSAEGKKHLAYSLTEKGKSLGPILGLMKDWGLQWEHGTHVSKSYQNVIH